MENRNRFDKVYGERITELFGEELLKFLTGEEYSEERRLQMEFKLIGRIHVLNAWYSEDALLIEENPQLCIRYWNLYRAAINFLAHFLGYEDFQTETLKDMSYILLEYYIYGKLRPTFVRETFANILLVKGSLERFD